MVLIYSQDFRIMKAEIKLQLLATVKYNLNVGGLIEMGLSYAEIGQQLALLTRAGYIDKDKDKIRLSQKGEAYFKGLSEKMNRNVNFLWIAPLFDEMIPKKDKNDVYLPKYWRI